MLGHAGLESSGAELYAELEVMLTSIFCPYSFCWKAGINHWCEAHHLCTLYYLLYLTYSTTGESGIHVQLCTADQIPYQRDNSLIREESRTICIVLDARITGRSLIFASTWNFVEIPSRRQTDRQTDREDQLNRGWSEERHLSCNPSIVGPLVGTDHTNPWCPSDDKSPEPLKSTVVDNEIWLATSENSSTTPACNAVLCQQQESDSHFPVIYYSLVSQLPWWDLLVSFHSSYDPEF